LVLVEQAEHLMEHQILDQIVPLIVKHPPEVVRVQVRLIQQVQVALVVPIVLLLQVV
jgi:hypothetical protein